MILLATYIHQSHITNTKHALIKCYSLWKDKYMLIMVNLKAVEYLNIIFLEHEYHVSRFIKSGWLAKDMKVENGHRRMRRLGGGGSTIRR
jgi:hypothetical protein